MNDGVEGCDLDQAGPGLMLRNDVPGDYGYSQGLETLVAARCGT